MNVKIRFPKLELTVGPVKAQQITGLYKHLVCTGQPLFCMCVNTYVHTSICAYVHTEDGTQDLAYVQQASYKLSNLSSFFKTGILCSLVWPLHVAVAVLELLILLLDQRSYDD